MGVGVIAPMAQHKKVFLLLFLQKKKCLLNLRGFQIECVSRSPYSADDIRLTGAVDGLAEPADMHVHRPRLDMDIPTPDGIQHVLAREHPFRMAQEKFQQPEFGGAQMQCAAVAQHPVRCRVQRDIVKIQFQLGRHATGTAQQRPDPGDQRLGRKWLG